MGEGREGGKYLTLALPQWQCKNTLKTSRRMLEMEINGQVGETAGKIWHVLNDEGPQTIPQLKKKLNGSGELLSFALGWLAREDKVDISQEKKNIIVALR